MQTHAWYLNPETGDTKVFLTCESEQIANAGYRLVELIDIPVLALHAQGLLEKTPQHLRQLLREGKITLDQLDYDEAAGQMFLAQDPVSE